MRNKTSDEINTEEFFTPSDTLPGLISMLYPGRANWESIDFGMLVRIIDSLVSCSDNNMSVCSKTRTITVTLDDPLPVLTQAEFAIEITPKPTMVKISETEPGDRFVHKGKTYLRAGLFSSEGKPQCTNLDNGWVVYLKPSDMVELVFRKKTSDKKNS